MNYSKEQIRNVITEERKNILSWLDNYNSMNPDITISQYEDDINSMCNNILKRFGINSVFGDF